MLTRRTSIRRFARPAAASAEAGIISTAPTRAVTRGPRHHSAGYYDQTPWDETGRYLLALEAPFYHRSPEAGDTATLGVVDLVAGEIFRPFAETRAWNWQQGCRLQWLPTAPDRLVIYNDRDSDRFVSIVCDALSGRQVRRLPLPIYAVSHDGRQAVTLDFSRLHHQRPGYGYAGVPDPWQQVPEPADDGIYCMDLETGAQQLVIPIAKMAQLRRKPSMDGAVHRFNHLQFSPDDSRFIFLHRWRHDGFGWTRLCTARPEGSDVAIVADEDRVSHFDWRDPSHLLAWACYRGRDGFYLFEDYTGDAVPIGTSAMPRDGHCSYSPDPDRRWILNDTYPDANHERWLYIYDIHADSRIHLGCYHSPLDLVEDLRCDLHPRWSRDGRHVCFESAHEGTRQLNVVDVSSVIGAR